MQGYEFMAEIQRLSWLATMMEAARVEAVLEHISFAESVAPVFGTDAQAVGATRLTALRGFVEKAVEFKCECAAYHDRLHDAERAAAATRLTLVDRNATHADPAPAVTPLGPGAS